MSPERLISIESFPGINIFSIRGGDMGRGIGLGSVGIDESHTPNLQTCYKYILKLRSWLTYLLYYCTMYLHLFLIIRNCLHHSKSYFKINLYIMTVCIVCTYIIFIRITGIWHIFIYIYIYNKKQYIYNINILFFVHNNIFKTPQ